jgi:hypothetical protein
VGFHKTFSFCSIVEQPAEVLKGRILGSRIPDIFDRDQQNFINFQKRQICLFKWTVGDLTIIAKYSA